MFSYILVVSTGYILLISICPMIKARKMKSMASSSIFANLFRNYFRVQKYGGFFDCFVLAFSTVDAVNRF